jgi:outer membrane protein assembly factor BamD
VDARRIVAVLLFACAASGCTTTKPVTEEVPPAEELYSEGVHKLEGVSILGVFTYVNYEDAIQIFQSIIDNYPYSEQAVSAELQIADAYFAQKKFEEALSYYRDFGELHPQHEKVAYTIYRSALCHQRQMKSPNRDQTATQKALGYLDRLLSDYPNTEYAREAEPLWKKLQTSLAEHVEGIADFYMSRGEFESAAERYRSLLNEYPGLGLDDRILYKLGRCYEALDRLDEADRIYRTIVAHYAESRYAYRARQRIAASLE